MPTGALLVNPSKPRRKISASALLSAIGAKKNGKGAKHRRNGALLTNRRHRFKKNGALLTNGKKNYGMKYNGMKHNGKRRRSYRRNPSMGKGSNFLSKLTSPVQRIVGKVPLVGKYASSALGYAVAGVGAGAGVVALYAAMQYAAPYFPEMIRPVGYTAAASVGAALLAGLAPNFPGKGLLVVGLPAAGVAIDTWRYLHDGSANLNGDMAGLGGDMGDAWGAVDDLGSPLAATEYADANLMDAHYSGDDMTDDEIAAAEFGRAQFWRIFRPRYAPAAAAPLAPQISHHAGAPGRRWGWLIYFLGMDRFQQLAKLPAGQRRQYIAGLRTDAIQRANRALSGGMDTSMEAANTAGLLVAA